ncbi:adenylate kinase family protein [Mycoplasmopsis cricetuli]|uniref:adenylate kinase family protein n=1 Tax=Mycoplasmopsis cricetuli TaxID=171283 RepID=UPI0004726EE1|nr:nucleoside monophosphate kinase [Mycoplasmopsis cricetuli]
MINKNLIFMGQPGVGKGTVANLITKLSSLKHISTGNIFREEIANQSPLGKEVERIVTTGGYVPDEITNLIVKNAIEQLQSQNQNFILDGYPRTLKQAKFLNTLKDLNFVVVELKASEEIILERLSGRRYCPKCKTGYHIKFQPPKIPNLCNYDNNLLIIRKDDEEQAIKLRLNLYNEQTKPLIEYYKQQGNLIQLNSVDNPEVIARKILEKIQ